MAPGIYSDTKAQSCAAASSFSIRTYPQPHVLTSPPNVHIQQGHTPAPRSTPLCSGVPYREVVSGGQHASLWSGWRSSFGHSYPFYPSGFWTMNMSLLFLWNTLPTLSWPKPPHGRINLLTADATFFLPFLLPRPIHSRCDNDPMRPQRSRTLIATG